MIVLLFIAAVSFLIIIFKFIFSPLRHRISLLIPIFVLFGAQRRRISCGWTVEDCLKLWRESLHGRTGRPRFDCFSRIRSFVPQSRLYTVDLELSVFPSLIKKE